MDFGCEFLSLLSVLGSVSRQDFKLTWCELKKMTKPIQANSPQWMADDASVCCLFCQRDFGFVRRRHHCRACGKLFCDSCSSARIALDKATDERVRVCVVCCKKQQKIAVGTDDLIGDTLASLGPLLELRDLELSTTKRGINVYRATRRNGKHCRVATMSMNCTLEELSALWDWNDLLLWFFLFSADFHYPPSQVSVDCERV